MSEGEGQTNWDYYKGKASTALDKHHKKARATAEKHLGDSLKGPKQKQPVKRRPNRDNGSITKTEHRTMLTNLIERVSQSIDVKRKKRVVETTDLLPYLIRPNSIITEMDRIKINDTYNQVLMAVGWPRKVPPGFLDRIIKSQGDFDLSIYIEPFSIEAMIVRLQQELEKQTADLQADTVKGKVNPSLENQIKDTREALDNLMLGNERMFNISLYLNAKAANEKDLQLLSKKLESDLNAINIIPKKPVFRMAQGLQSVLPLANDKLKVTRNIPTGALSACFPFTTAFLEIQDSGIMMGINKDNNIPIVLDVFQKPFTNPNGLVLATSGSGKSYLMKLAILRHLMRGTRVLIIDPQKEYTALTKEYNGELITISRNSNTIINPLDLLGQDLGEKLLTLESLFEIMLEPNENQKGILSKAVMRTYNAKKILKDDPKSWERDPPTLGDLYDELEKMAKKASGDEKTDYSSLLNRLHRFVFGAFSFLNKKTSISLHKDLVTFNIKDMPEKAQPIAMFLILEYVYKTMMRDKERKLLVVDEAWSLLQHASESNYVFKIVKTSRKFNLGLVIITQEVKDLLNSSAGEAVLANTSYTYLLRQKPAVIDAIIDKFKLNTSERNMIITAGIGEGLLMAENEHIPIRIVASKKEHALVTTHPEEVKEREKD